MIGFTFYLLESSLYNFVQNIEMCLYNWDTRQALYDWCTE